MGPPNTHVYMSREGGGRRRGREGGGEREGREGGSERGREGEHTGCSAATFVSDPHKLLIEYFWPVFCSIS